MAGAGAKIAAADLLARLDWFEPHVHGVQPRMLSITQATERGAIYTPQEIRALAKIAHEHGMAVHMDGARFANALVAQKVAAAELTWKAGVDVLSFGVIKNGGMNAEAVVFFDPTRVADFEFRRKRAGQLPAKDDTLRCSSLRTSKVVCGSAMPSEPTGSRHGSPPRRPSCSASRWRPTRCS